MRSNGTSWEWLELKKHMGNQTKCCSLTGQIICVTDIGENGSLWRGTGTKWVKLHAVKYYNNTTPVSLTGTTAETTMLTIPVKGRVDWRKRCVSYSAAMEHYEQR